MFFLIKYDKIIRFLYNMKNLELFNGKWRNTQNRENLYFLQNPSSRVQGNLSSIEAKLSASHKIELNNL